MHGLENIAFIGEGCEKLQKNIRNFVSDILSFPNKIISLVKTLTIVTLSGLKEIEMGRLLDQGYRRGLRLKHKKTNLNKK